MASTAVSIMMDLLAENIGRGVTDYCVYGDRILDAIVNSNRVQRAGFMGRNDNAGGSFRANHRIKLSRAGDWSATPFNSTTVTQIGDGAYPVGLALNNKRLDPTKMPQQKIENMYLDLKRLEGNVTLDLDQIHGIQHGQALADYVTDQADDQIKNMRDAMATLIFLDGNGKLGEITGTPTIAEATQTTVTVRESSVRRFEIGKRYQIADGSTWPTTMTRRGTGDGAIRCVGIDYATSTPNAASIIFQSESGTGSIVCVDGDVIVKHGTVDYSNNVSYLPSGFDNLIGNTGTLHGLSRTTYPMLKSIVDTNPSGAGTNRPPEPKIITQILSKIIHSGFMPPSLLIAQKDVRDRYFQLEQQRSVYNVPMRMAYADGGMGTVQTSYEGMVLGWIESSFVAPNKIIGVSPEKMIKYSPAGTEAIQWYLNQGGSAHAPTQFQHVNSGSQITNVVQAPYQWWVEFGVTEPMSHFQVQDCEGSTDV